MGNDLLYENAFDSDTADFVVEGRGSVEVKNGRLYLDDTRESAGLTVWLDRTFGDNIHIMYESMVVEPAGGGNINFFFAAKTLDDRYVLEEERSGKYDEYHESCKLYILTFVGDFQRKNGRYKGHTRVRKDPGFQLLSEDLERSSELNKHYFCEIIKSGPLIECRINDEIIHRVTDTDPYTDGSIGFRTWNTHLWFDNLKVHGLE